ncbi:MAG: hypothetical protein ACO1SV_24255 [Fimbriimonas sp.]
MDEKESVGSGSDATTGDEQGIGSGVGSGPDTEAGSIDGLSTGVTSGTTPVGGDTGAIGIAQSVGEKLSGPIPSGPGTLSGTGLPPTGGVVPNSGDNTYPRAANGDLTRSDDLEFDSERLPNVERGDHPDAG